MQHRTVEIFSAGCPLCLEALQLVRTIVDESWSVRVYNMETGDAFAKAREYGVTRVPSIVIDGRLARCCQLEELNETVLRELLESSTDH